MPRWNPDDPGPVVAVAVCTLAFLVYWFLSRSEGVRAWMEGRYGPERTRVRHVLFQKYTGALVLGVLPALVVLAFLGAPPSQHGLRFDPETWDDSLAWILGAAVVLLPVGFFAARREEAWRRYPQIRTPVWTPDLVLQNAIAWAAYLLAYEYLFRGLLLFECAGSFGAWPAVVVSTSLYSFAHLPKGAAEAIGAIPFGVALCLLTLATGTLWIAFFAHLTLALSNDFFAVYHQPGMTFERA